MAEVDGSQPSSARPPRRVSVAVVADRPDLTERLAELRWREWGDEPGREALAWWVADASQDTGRDAMPVGLVALDERDDVLGGVSLRPFEHEELRDRAPWVQGMVVRPDRRGQEIGRRLLRALEG